MLLDSRMFMKKAWGHVFTPKFGIYGRNRGKLSKFGKCRVFFTGPVRPQVCRRSDRLIRPVWPANKAGLTTGIWSVKPSRSESKSVFVGSWVSLLGNACFGFALVSIPSWMWRRVCRGKNQPLFKDKAGSIVIPQTNNILESFFLLSLLFSYVFYFTIILVHLCRFAL